MNDEAQRLTKQQSATDAADPATLRLQGERSRAATEAGKKLDAATDSSPGVRASDTETDILDGTRTLGKNVDDKLFEKFTSQAPTAGRKTDGADDDIIEEDSPHEQHRMTAAENMEFRDAVINDSGTAGESKGSTTLP